LNLVSNLLVFKSNKFLNQNKNLELVNDQKTNLIDFYLNEKINLNNYIFPNLRYKNISSCLLIQPNQFIDRYTIVGYLESVTTNSLEVVKIKLKNKENKKILLISNEDCLTVKKNQFPNKKLNDFIVNSKNGNEIGKVLIENNEYLTIQKGRPYFFPNCKNDDLINKVNLQYKILPQKRSYPRFNTNYNISLNYYDIMKILVKRNPGSRKFLKSKFTLKTEFSKFFLKRNGKLYSSLIPQFIKKFSINKSLSTLKCETILKPQLLTQSNLGKIDRTILLQSFNNIQNQYKKNDKYNSQLTFVKFSEYSFSQTNKSIGLYSITEDFLNKMLIVYFVKIVNLLKPVKQLDY
jgi:hypothetical protein